MTNMEKKLLVLTESRNVYLLTCLKNHNGERILCKAYSKNDNFPPNVDYNVVCFLDQRSKIIDEKVSIKEIQLLRRLGIDVKNGKNIVTSPIIDITHYKPTKN